MSLHPARLRLLERRVLPALLALNLLLLLYYLIVDYQLVLNSDSAVMNLLAQEIHDSGQLFPSDWYYANGDLWVWFTQLPIVPLLYVLPNSAALHALSDIVTAALLLLSAWCVSGMLGQSRLARLTLLLVLTSGISVNMAENLYGQAAYGVLTYLACLLAYSGWQLLHAQGTARWRWGAALAALALLVFWSNPQRAIVFYGLPLIVATVVLHSLPGQPRRRAVLLLAVLAAAMLAGTALHSHYVRLVGNSGLAPATWLGYDGMVHNTLATVRGLLSLLGGLPQEGSSVLSAGGALAALRLLAALLLLALLPWALLRACRTPIRRARLYFAVFTLTSAAINLLVALCTSLPDMTAPEASIRYLVPSLLCMLILLAGMAVDDFKWSRPAPALALAALLALGLSAPLAYRVPNAPGYFPHGGIASHNPYAGIARYLEQQGLHHGYANFWSAGKLTVLSAGQVQLRQITLENGLPMPVRHLSSARWYQAASWQGETFLMFNYDEAKQVDWAQLERYIGQPSRVLDYAGCKIAVYPHNLAAAMPLWDYHQAVALRVPLDAATRHAIGQLIADEQGNAIVAEPGAAGYLQYGPYRQTPKGRYLASFDLDTAGAGVADFGVVDVAAAGGSQVLAARAVKAGGVQHISLPIELHGPVADLELRVWSNGAGRMTLHGSSLTVLADH
jgi:hypothetical protein